MQLRSIAAIEPNHRAAVISPVPEVTPKKSKNPLKWRGQDFVLSFAGISCPAVIYLPFFAAAILHMYFMALDQLSAAQLPSTFPFNGSCPSFV
jgi:hypothetical protein